MASTGSEGRISSEDRISSGGSTSSAGRPRAGRGFGSGGRRREEPADADAFAGPAADPESVGRTILLDQLTGRARSRAELRDKLASRDVPDDVAERLLDRFTEVGLIDDAAFARSWVESRQAGKGLARRALAQELRRKGLSDDVVREAVDEVDAGDEEAAARRLVRAKLRSMARLDETTKARRLVGLLGRKGYPAGLAFAVVRDELRSDLLDDAVE